MVATPPTQNPHLHSATPEQRLKPGQSLVTFVAPKPTAYTFHKHFDYGLLREVDPPSGYFEAWSSPVWHHISFNPFSASMSTISEDMAQGLIGKGDLHAPADDAEYERQTAENGARRGL
jgi:hypothetical protein